MRRRNKTGGRAAKTQRPKTLKRRNAAKVGREAPAIGATERIALLEHRLNEALEQQTATSDVLGVISSSPGELKPVFEAILESATRICTAKFANLFLYADNSFRIAAQKNAPLAYAERWRQRPVLAVGDNPHNPLDRLASTKSVINIPDLMAERGYIERNPRFVALVEAAGARSHVAVPMLKEGELIGAISIFCQEVRPFTDKQIKLVKNFAAQAVIAIENTRLLNELRESLQQQTATADVLKIISSSPGQLEPVFEAMLANAMRICGAKFGTLFLCEGDDFRVVAQHNTPPALAELRRREPIVRAGPRTATRRSTKTRQAVQIADIATEQAYLEPDPYQREAFELGGYRAVLSVPMLKDDEVIGAINIYRQDAGAFFDKQIELVKNFAAQAVIAIENTRLLNELRQRTDDLSESLEQQTATSEVLRVISSSPTNVQPVFDAIAESAVRLCGAQFCFVVRLDGNVMDFASSSGLSAEGLEAFRRLLPQPASEDTASGRAILRRAVVEIPDVEPDPAYGVKGLANTVTYRSIVGVPLLHEGNPIGAIAVARANIGSFPKRQIGLLQAFADQAVIAIENVRLFDEVQARTRDLSESLQQQTATADVLKVISRSTFDLQTVLDTLTESAARLCAADKGAIMMREGDAYWIRANYGFADEAVQYALNHPLQPNRGSATARAALEGRAIHIPDVLADPEYRAAGYQKAFGYRSILGIPLLREGAAIGTFTLTRDEVNPFTDKQIALATTFADQAVIAIENVRLFDEVQARTREAQESLEYQTAVSDVLNVISRSPNALQPVLDTIVQTAARLCAAQFSVFFRLHEGKCHIAASNAEADFIKFAREHPIIPTRASCTGRAVLERRTVHVLDASTDPEYAMPDYQLVANNRTMLGVPLLREGVPLGTITLWKTRVEPFTEKQIELVTTFADQALIAIENVRLFDAERQRTRELGESLEQQTATSEVLKVISSSPGELQPVFQAMLENATRICEAKFGALYRCEGDALRAVAMHGAPQSFVEERRRNPVIRPGPTSTLGRALATKQPVQIADILTEPHYFDAPSGYSGAQIAKLAGARTVLAVPMLKDNELVGAIVIYRQEVRPFTDKQIELVSNFAAQAVIAIENTRLLNELRSRTNELAQSVGELQALGEISQAVNSTLDLEMVLTTIVGRAVQLSHTDAGAIYVFDEEIKEFRLHATYGMSEAMIAAITDQHIGIGDSNIGAATTQRKPIQVPDIREQPSPVNEIVLREGYRGILIIPLLRPDHIVGALVVRRKTPGEFPQATIELLQTFADQSVVAIQNARLFESIEARTRELTKSLEDLRTAQDRLVQTEKLASLGQLTAGIAHEIKNPLNFVNNFSGVSVELIDELREALAGAKLNKKLRAEISEIADMLQGNLDKIVQHGKRADAIVKNMLLHSREGSGEHRPVDINALVEESLNLAWHGARAEKQGFNITLERSFDPAAGEADCFPQEITRALLNLISNGFYAATKHKAEANGGGYEPTLTAATKSLGDRVEIRIRDNGTGIPPEVKDKLFNPFFTTKPAGEGTGLGLSISHDIIVKQHGGSIEVDTQPGEFTEFRIVLPRAALGQQ